MTDWEQFFTAPMLRGHTGPAHLPRPLVKLLAEAATHYQHGEQWNPDTARYEPIPDNTPPPGQQHGSNPAAYYMQDHGAGLLCLHKPTGIATTHPTRDTQEAIDHTNHAVATHRAKQPPTPNTYRITYTPDPDPGTYTTTHLATGATATGTDIDTTLRALQEDQHHD